ncbi:MAG: type II toxin-antitoxin system RelE/ParE family toxin [Candidatus Scalindua rubra]|nr:type II toxin-antitoxin system RelE/ParE family toxin [Candidatus Scalindua rubra]
MQTVVELPEYLRKIKKLLIKSDSEGIVNYLACHPKAGTIMPGTGGVRKFRWEGHGAGKRGGLRIVYYFHNENTPLFLLTVFGKNEKTNLTKSERNELAKFVCVLVKSYGGINE